MTRIVLLLGDQLTPDISSLAAADRDKDVVLMAEVEEEARYVDHHKQKLVLVFSAMRHFARELESDGWNVRYHRLDADESFASLQDAVSRALEDTGANGVLLTEPGEWRLFEQMRNWQDSLGTEVTLLEDDRFVCSRAEFCEWADGRKSLTMEYFYREMRRKTGLLMDGDEPLGGEWNFDAENRKRPDKNVDIPSGCVFKPDQITREVIEMVGKRFADNFGSLEHFAWAVTRDDAQTAQGYFIDCVLPCFGDYQDAMLTGEKTLWHSVLSPYINLGLLDPLALCKAVEQACADGKVPINSAEGFIRQVIGWREFIRGVYWLKMPAYRELNALDADRPLPDFYWTAETDMHCLSQAISQTIDFAYAHHIQRLMITGTFALLIGADPKAVHEWYLGVYADAYEWVELPNTLGMSQFADGGIVGTKPYAASANYINKMSDYCKHCRYDPKLRTGSDACPWTSLYWHFVDRHAARLEDNRRTMMMVRNWQRMSDEDKSALRSQAKKILSEL